MSLRNRRLTKSAPCQTSLQFNIEFADPIPFPDDDVHASYDRDAVERFFDALTRVATVMHAYRAEFRGRFGLTSR